MSYLRNLLARTYEPNAGLRPLRTSLANSVAEAVPGFREQSGFAEGSEESSWPVSSRVRGGLDPVEVGPSWRSRRAVDEGAPIEGVRESLASGEAVALATESPVNRFEETEAASAMSQASGRATASADGVRRRSAGQFPAFRAPGLAQAPEAVAYAEKAALQSAGKELSPSGMPEPAQPNIPVALPKFPAAAPNSPAAPNVAYERLGRAPSRRDVVTLGEHGEASASADLRGGVQHMDAGRVPVAAEPRDHSDAAGSRMQEVRGTAAAVQALEARPIRGVERPASAQVPTSRYARRQFVPPAEPQVERGEPTVHITIGRLEVRGSTPAQAPRQAKPASSVPTLDDYLQARNREQRRE